MHDGNFTEVVARLLNNSVNICVVAKLMCLWFIQLIWINSKKEKKKTILRWLLIEFKSRFFAIEINNQINLNNIKWNSAIKYKVFQHLNWNN